MQICIIGVGYVGEHLMNTFKNKYNVIGVDISEKRVNFLKNTYSYPNVKFQNHFDNLENCDVFLVSVPTLVKQNEDIDVSCLHSAKETLLNIANPGSLIVIESSVYVGATRELFTEFLNKNIYVGFSPERVDPGRTEPPMEDIPKVISGLTEQSLEKIKEIYSKVIKNIVPVSSCETAEMCKLYENCFRMVNIAYVNEIADMCEYLKIDAREVINAASTKPFGFMPFYPGIGVGGHCIPVNPYYLFKTGNLPVLRYATEITKTRPRKKVKEIILKNPDSKNILICGIGFKKGECLTTNSPAYEMLKEFNKKGYNVMGYDINVQKEYSKDDIKFLNKSELNSETLRDKFDLIIVNYCLLENDIQIINDSNVKTIYF
jgi:nucleotide sugar dehydrogenase